MKKLYLLTIGALAENSIIESMSKNLNESSLHKHYDVVWVIVVPNSELKQLCLSKLTKSFFKINILVNDRTRNDRLEIIRDVLLKMPMNSMIWMLPEGAIVTPTVGGNLFDIMNSHNMPAQIGEISTSSVDNVVFYRPEDHILSNIPMMLDFIEKQKNSGIKIPLDMIYFLQGASTDFDKLSVIYSNSRYNRSFYNKIYEPIFSKIRTRNFSLLEIGVSNGSGLKTFRDFFPHANIFGLDTDPKLVLKENKINTILGDSTLIRTADELKLANNGNKFDIIIDNKNTNTDAQFETFKNFWPILNKNSLYFIENVLSPEDLELKIKNFDSTIPFVRKDLSVFSTNPNSILLCLFKHSA